MKKLTSLLFLVLFAFGTTLHADYQDYNSYESYNHEQYYDPCDPCAPACGTSCAMNWCCIGLGVAAVAAFIAVIATNSDPSSSHSHGS